MPPAAISTSPSERSPATPVMVPMQAQFPVSDAFAKDAIIGWFRGEFAAANAIIDALCNHLTLLDGGGSEYDSVFSAIHRRRLNWIPILQMQKYHSIADVAAELRHVAARKVEVMEKTEVLKEERIEDRREVCEEESVESNGTGGGEVVDEDSAKEDSPESEITDSGSLEVQHIPEIVDICTNHEDCETRREQIKMTKGFVAKEPVKGHMVNVVKGLKLFDEIFTESELAKLADFVNELQFAGRNGELTGETFKLFNQQVKGNKRELIQLGVPIFGQIKEENGHEHQKNKIEPIPALIQAVIDHLIMWRLIPETRKPNSCIINYFDEGEYSQPFLKPPHLDQPVCTLLLSESTMAFGRILVGDNDGNFKGPLMLSLKEGSLLVMRGNSADMARHVMCPSPNKRTTITFFRVRPEPNEIHSPTKAMTLWQPGVPHPYSMPNEALNGYNNPAEVALSPKWGVLRAPMVMLAPVHHPMVLSPKRLPQGGTGVFLPWTVGSRKHTKHLPPRAQKNRHLALPAPVETRVAEKASD